MTPEEKKEIVDQALIDVNRIREQHGVAPLTDLPKGGRAYDNCPMANALRDVNPGACMYFGLYTLVRNGPIFRAPDGMRQFVREFSLGKLPEYDL